MKNIEKNIAVEKNKNIPNNMKQQIEWLKNTLSTRENQSRLAKNIAWVDLEKIKYLANIEKVANNFTKVDLEMFNKHLMQTA